LSGIHDTPVLYWIIAMNFVDKTVFARLQAKTVEIAQRQLVALAHEEHAKVIARCEPSAHSTAVDGRPGAPVESVKPFGVVHFEYSYFSEIAKLALEVLKAKSPVDTGDYAADHSIYIDGVLTPADRIGMAQRMVVANVEPYARIIEVGRGRRVPWSKQPQVPSEGVYHHVVKAIRRKYSSIVSARFAWVGLDENQEVPDAKRTKRYPAIVVEMR
jgi:hypothetical protein